LAMHTLQKIRTPIPLSKMRLRRTINASGVESSMANVLVSMKIFPTDITVDFNQLKKQIEKSLPKGSSVMRFNEEPIAFGLNALIAHILIPEEKSGELEKVENTIRGIEGVSNIETFMMQRW